MEFFHDKDSRQIELDFQALHVNHSRIINDEGPKICIHVPKDHHFKHKCMPKQIFKMADFFKDGRQIKPGFKALLKAY